MTGDVAGGTTTVTWEMRGAGANPQLTIASGLGVGNGSFSSISTYTTIVGLLVTDGIDLTIGSPGSRVAMTLGQRGDTNVNGGTQGRLNVLNGKFEAYLSSLTLGTKAGFGGGATGTLDLAATTIQTPKLDISGDANLGNQLHWSVWFGVLERHGHDRGRHGDVRREACGGLRRPAA